MTKEATYTMEGGQLIKSYTAYLQCFCQLLDKEYDYLIKGEYQALKTLRATKEEFLENIEKLYNSIVKIKDLKLIVEPKLVKEVQEVWAIMQEKAARNSSELEIANSVQKKITSFISDYILENQQKVHGYNRKGEFKQKHKIIQPPEVSGVYDKA